ncbi:hypothetical protein J3F84DRAFT_243500 [Trichoderma pleuroticola]
MAFGEAEWLFTLLIRCLQAADALYSRQQAGQGGSRIDLLYPTLCPMPLDNGLYFCLAARLAAESKPICTKCLWFVWRSCKVRILQMAEPHHFPSWPYTSKHGNLLG